jgi:hypothetical protein
MALPSPRAPIPIERHRGRRWAGRDARKIPQARWRNARALTACQAFVEAAAIYTFSLSARTQSTTRASIVAWLSSNRYTIAASTFMSPMIVRWSADTSPS